MSFWTLSTGEDARETDGTFEIAGGDLKPIPSETSVLASIDEAKWDADKEGNQFVSLRWSVLAPEEYKNRKIFQKLWIKDPDPRAKDADKKKDKAVRMFAAIDKNCGGKIMASDAEPTSEKLALNLCGKPMVAVVMVWDMTNETTGEKMTGNWIAKVSPRNAATTASATTTTTVAAMSSGATAKAAPATKDIPF